MSDVKSLVSTMAKTAGRSVPNSWLGDVGMAAGNGISRIFGLGAYRIERNSLFDSKTGSQVPFMHSSNESISFCHREYIGDIQGSTTFTSTGFTINPGDPATFPYLSTLAACFQEYKVKGLYFIYKSSSAVSITNATNTSMGTVSLMAQYKADAPAPTSKQEILNSMWSVDGRPSETIELPIECAPKENPLSMLYVRNGPVTGDVKMYDLATVYVATNGMPGINVIGELWVTYDIEFYKPRLPQVGGLLSTYHATKAGTTGTHPFGLIQTEVETAAPFIDTVVANTVSFKPNVQGRFLIQVYHQGTSEVLSAGAVSFTQCSGVLWFNNNLNNYVHAPANGVATVVASFSIVVDIPGGTAGLAAGVTVASGQYPSSSVVDVIVTEIDADAD